MQLLVGLVVACEPPPEGISDDEPAVHIEPADPRAGYDPLRCVAPGIADPTFGWTADGIVFPATGDTVPAEQTRAGRVWQCTASGHPSPPTTVRAVGGNLLVLLADDVGREVLAVEGMAENPRPTPNLDALASRSVRFVNAWSAPVCSPTRASILTGRLPRQHGVTDVLTPGSRWALPDAEVFLPQVLRTADVPVTSGWVGKWHLNARSVGSAERQPEVAGFELWKGTNGNLGLAFDSQGRSLGYIDWEYNDEGRLVRRQEYATAVTVDDATEAMAELEPPWFLYVGLHATHEPWHVPPAEWRYNEPSAAPTNLERVGLMLESLDIAVGRILDALPEDQRAETTVVFLSDNGTNGDVAGPLPASQAKGSVFQGGVNVPFWVSGPLVAEPGSVSEGLVHTADLFDTALAMAGVLPGEVDARVGRELHPRYGESLLPYLADPHRPSIRRYLYTEKAIPNGPPPYSLLTAAVTDGRWKLARLLRPDPGDDFLGIFDLETDPTELRGIVVPETDEEIDAWDRLNAELARFDEELVFEY